MFACEVFSRYRPPSVSAVSDCAVRVGAPPTTPRRKPAPSGDGPLGQIGPVDPHFRSSASRRGPAAVPVRRPCAARCAETRKLPVPNNSNTQPTPIAVMGASPPATSTPLHVAASASNAKPNATARPGAAHARWACQRQARSAPPPTLERRGQPAARAQGERGETGEQRRDQGCSNAGGHGSNERQGPDRELDRAGFECGSAHGYIRSNLQSSEASVQPNVGARRETPRWVLARCPGVLASGVPRLGAGRSAGVCALLWKICRIVCTNGARAPLCLTVAAALALGPVARMLPGPRSGDESPTVARSIA
jgi:hypothetical protein